MIVFILFRYGYYHFYVKIKENIMELSQKIERSIIKEFRKSIWNRFIMEIKQYQLINNGDKIAVCISSGKDSMLMTKCM